MSKAQKLLAAMESNPRDWQIEQVETVAQAFGLTVRRPGGSHCIVRHPNGRKVSVPAHRPIKPIYIRQFVRLVKHGTGDEE
jgi:predicted RNA binding protein YcfA (HicA-like mRNA interferase family)